jgi:hypothetical protein
VFGEKADSVVEDPPNKTAPVVPVAGPVLVASAVETVDSVIAEVVMDASVPVAAVEDSVEGILAGVVLSDAALPTVGEDSVEVAKTETVDDVD